MKYFFISILISCLCWACQPSNEGVAGEWNIVPTGISQKLTNVFFINASTGWAVGDNIILASNNGGKSWTTQLIDPYSNFTCVWFIDPSNGWVAGAGGKIFKTNNGGATWTSISIENNKSFQDIHFVDLNTGWLVGFDNSPEGALVSTTVNGGLTWQNHIFVNPTQIYNGAQQYYAMDRIFALDAKQIYVSGNGQWFVNSPDAGQTWTDLSDHTPPGEHRSIFFFDKQNGWLLSPPGRIFRTTDGGLSWVRYFQASNDLYSITFPSTQKGWAVGENSTIVHTNDGGRTWFKDDIVLQYIQSLNQVFFTDSTHGWIVGDNGVILRYFK